MATKGHLFSLLVVVYILSVAWGCFYQHGVSYHGSVGRRAHTRSKRQAVSCDGSKYRSYDGSCHNEASPAMGSTGSTFRRIIPAEYEDGLGMPRLTGDSGAPLPNPRDVSVRVHDPLDRLSNNLNQMVMQWGQFLDHDITFTPTAAPSSPVGCCDVTPHPDVAAGGPCDPIILPSGDAYFSEAQRCMYFERSANVTDARGVRQQYNDQTAWIDGSHIYGTTPEMALRLRAMEGGRLLTKDIDGHQFLPEDVDADKEAGCFLREGSDDYCFLAGDPRVMAYPGLNLMHTVFLRWHNLVAGEMAALRPEWSDEQLYQEARRVVVATLQKITYDEFLPILIGDSHTENIVTTAAYSYDAGRDADLPNSFSAASFRYGHSMIGDSLTIGGTTTATGILFNRPRFVLDSMFDLMTGLLDEPMMRTDRWYTAAMTNQMFEQPAPGDIDTGVRGTGSDIAARNVHRGRDHGLPSYNAFKRYCGQNPNTDFDLDGSGGTINRFRQTYASPEDIDLYSGGVSESLGDGAQVGELYQCLLRETFEDLKFGDRFWYQNDLNADQATEIDRLRLASVLCATIDDVTTIQRNPFRMVDDARNNPRMDCNDLPRLSVQDWFEEVAEAPVTEAPATEAPVTHAPVTEAPATQAPATEVPATQAPVTQAPETEAPVTAAPVTQAPATQAPVTDRPRRPQQRPRRPRTQELKRLIDLLDAELE